MSTTQLRSKVVSDFKMHGLSLRGDATHLLVQFLQSESETRRNQWLERLIEKIQGLGLSRPVVGKDDLKAALEECVNAESAGEELLLVIDAFTVPRFTYVPERKKYVADSVLGKTIPSLLGDSDDKASIFVKRYTILYERMSRHELFAPAVIGSSKAEGPRFTLRKIEYLLGTTEKLDKVIILGMLTQLKEGKLYLEDPTGAIELDLSEAISFHKFHTGLFTENCFVLVEGEYIGSKKILKVITLGSPPAEPIETSRRFLGDMNFFGGPSAKSLRGSEKLKLVEERNSEAIFVFLSDVWLDHPGVMERLQTLFRGFSDFPPVAFVFLGNFLHASYGMDQAKELRDKLKHLGYIIISYPQLAQASKFIFVPGPKDPGIGGLLPRPMLPEFVTQDLAKDVPNAIFATNPCRIQYCTKEIVVLREDVLSKMCRHCIYFPSSGGDIAEHFVKTICGQGHLCPMAPHVSPTLWTSDHALNLFPLPDLVVVGDKFKSFTESHMGCTIINPGTLPRNEFLFKVYYPVTGQVDDSQISNLHT